MIKSKLKQILPSLREKKRYLVFEVISEQKIVESELVSNAVLHHFSEFVGNLGCAKSGLIILNNKWNPELQKGVIKINNKHVDALKASLTFIDKIDNKQVIFRSIGLSGILNKAERKF